MYEKFERVLVDKVDKLFEDGRARAIAALNAEHLNKFLILEAPGIKFRYSATDDELVGILKVLACDALITYALFHFDKPSGFPELPISFDACKDMKDKRDPRAQLVGCFGYSQLLARWDENHPAFRLFCRGLLADKRTPKRLREDPELQQMFPPKRLEGLVEGSYWTTPDMLKGWINLVARIDASVRQPIDSVLMVAQARRLGLT